MTAGKRSHLDKLHTDAGVAMSHEESVELHLQPLLVDSDPLPGAVY